MIGNRFSLAGALAVTAALAVLLPLAPPAVAANHHKHDKHKAADDKPAKPIPGGIELLGKSGGWSAYASNASSGKVCYLVSEPGKSEPAKFTRKQPMAMVTHRPAEHISNVVSFVEGYPLKPGSNLVLLIDGHKYELFTKDDSAWASTSELDRTIVAAMQKGRHANARGQAADGTTVVDSYSLSGFSKALGLIDKACGLERDGRETQPVHPASHHPQHHHRSHHEKHR